MENVRASTTVPERGSIRARGLDFPFVTEGEGRPALVYSLLGYHLRTFSPEFRRRLRCTFVQARFAIPEASTSEPFSIDAAVEDLEAARAALGLDRFVVVGHSVQGVVALAYARRYPERATHVIAIGAFPELSPRLFDLAERGWEAKASPERKAALDRRRAGVDGAALARLSPGEALVEGIVADGPKRWFDASFDERALLSHDRLNAPLLVGLFEQEYRLLPDGERFRTPVLLAEGRLDWELGGEAIWTPYRDRFDDLTVEVFERSGHVPQLEEAGVFDARVAAWLDRR